MRPMRLSEVCAAVGGRQDGAGDPLLNAVGIDTRKLQPGELFVAIRGPRLDGHAFVAAAAAAGAAAALVEDDADYPLPVCRVADARGALAALARVNRRSCRARVAAVTGSNGKTTVKEMLASILRQQGETLATLGNLNNELGVPLTLLRLNPEHAYAVVEMGANHPGEIARLAAIAEPDIGLVTNAGPAHLEGFGDLLGVARAKGELFDGLAQQAAAVVNADDDYAPLWRQLAGTRRRLEFGLEPGAAVSAEPVEDHWRLVTPAGAAELRLPLPGRHNLRNALGAAAAALLLDVPLEAVVRGLEATPVVAGRLQWRRGLNRARLLDDSYNANPASLRAGIEVLTAEPGEPWLVLGEMAELGDDPAAVHGEAGRMARALGVRRLYSCGPVAAAAAEAFGEGGTACAGKAELIDILRPQLAAGVCVLFKGSRRAGLEEVVAALEGKDA